MAFGGQTGGRGLLGTSMQDPRTQGLLNASAALLQGGRPQVGTPTSLGGNIGSALAAYNKSYMDAVNAEEQRKRQAANDEITNRYKTAQAAQMEEAARRAKLPITESIANGAFLKITDPETGEVTFKKQEDVADFLLESKKANQKPNVLPDSLAKQQTEDLDAIRTVQDINEQVEGFLDDIDEGELVFGFTSGLADSALGRLVGAGGGKFTQKRNEFRRFMNRLRNELLRIAKGVQTDGDAQRALDELLLPDENLSTQSVKNALEFMYNNNVKTISRLQKKVDDLRAAKGMKKYDFGDQNTMMGVRIGGTP